MTSSLELVDLNRLLDRLEAKIPDERSFAEYSSVERQKLSAVINHVATKLISMY